LQPSSGPLYNKGRIKKEEEAKHMHWIILKKATRTSKWEAHSFLYGNKREAEKIAREFKSRQGVFDTCVPDVAISLPDGSYQDVP